MTHQVSRVKCAISGVCRTPEIEHSQSRFAAIAALVQLSETPRRQRFPHLTPDGQCVRNWTEAVAWCAASSGRSIRGIWALWGAFRRSGHSALSNKSRSDKGCSRFFQRRPGAAVFVSGLYLAGIRNTRSILFELEQNCGALGVRRDQLPSYESLRRWLRSIDQSLLVDPRKNSGAIQGTRRGLSGADATGAK